MSLRAQAIAEGFKYIALRGSKIVAFASTKAEAAREGTPEKLPSVPAKYLRGFKGKARVRRVLEILRERRKGTFEPLSSDKGVSTKRSKWSVKFEQTYGERPDDIADVARLTGVPRAVLKQVYDRGLAAWSTGGHRPGASQHGWAMARVQSFVLGGPTTRTADKDLVKNPAFVETYGDGASVELGSGALAADSDLLKEGFDLVSTAYAPIGGHLNINEPDDLLNEGTTFYFADIDKDPEADVLQVSKRKKAGLKMSAVGHDGQKASRRHLIQYKIDRLHEPGNYAEVSGRIAEILLGVGVPVVNDKATVERMLGKKVRWLGTNKDFPRTSGWYSRKIGKSNHKKVLVGTPLTANPIRLKGGDETRQFARIVAEAYASAPDFDPAAVPAYEALGRSIEKIYNQILSKVDVRFVEGQPYESDEQMAREVARSGVLYISKDFNEHPIYTPEQNLKARAVHDWFAHILPGADFSQRGELKAYNRQLKMTPKKAWPALFTEVVGQAAYATVHGEFPEQKIAILDGFDYYNVGRGSAVEAAKARGVEGTEERDPTAEYEYLDLQANPRTFKDRIKEVQALNLGLVQVSVDPYKAYCVIDSAGEVVGALATMPPPPSEVFGEDGEIYTNRCWDAPMVFFSAVSRDYQGKGLGGLLYLWAMAAGDGLFPDRASVSEKASRVWERLREMDETVWFEFDDIEAPRTHRFEDDCLVYDDPDEEHLDGVYELKHSDAVKVLQAVKPLLKKGEQYRGDLSDKLLYQAASFLFESVY